MWEKTGARNEWRRLRAPAVTEASFTRHYSIANEASLTGRKCGKCRGSFSAKSSLPRNKKTGPNWNRRNLQKQDHLRARQEPQAGTGGSPRAAVALPAARAGAGGSGDGARHRRRARLFPARRLERRVLWAREGRGRRRAMDRGALPQDRAGRRGCARGPVLAPQACTPTLSDCRPPAGADPVAAGPGGEKQGARDRTVFLEL